MNLLTNETIDISEIYLKKIFSLEQELEFKLSLIKDIEDQLSDVEKKMNAFFLYV